MASIPNKTLILNEKVLLELKFMKSSKQYKMTFTNYRIFFEYMGKNRELKEVDIYYADPISHQLKFQDNKHIVNLCDRYYFELTSLEDQQEFDRMLQLIDVIKSKNDYFLLRFKELAENPTLYTLYEQLLIKGGMNEEEFWKERAIINEFKKEENLAEQTLSKTLKPLHSNVYEGAIKDIHLKEKDKIELLKREPQLKKKFQSKCVAGDLSEADFWKRFLAVQKIHETIIVGGINPIYLEEEKNGVEEDKGEVEVDLELDLINNFERNGLEEELLKDTVVNGGKKELLISNINRKNERILEEELLKKDRDHHHFSLDEDKHKSIARKDEGDHVKEIRKKEENKAMEIEVKGRERKSEIGGEEKKAQMKVFQNDVMIFMKNLQEYKLSLLNDENPLIKQIFKNSSDFINSKLNSQVSVRLSKEEIENLERNSKILNNDVSQLLSYFYSTLMNLKKVGKEPRLMTRLNDINNLLRQKKEQIIKLIQREANNKKTKVISNLEEKLDLAMQAYSDFC